MCLRASVSCLVFAWKPANGAEGAAQRAHSQLKEQVSGISEQIEAKAEESALIGEEWKGVFDLWKKQLIQINRVTSLKRDAARLGGERGQLIAAKAEAGGKSPRSSCRSSRSIRTSAARRHRS